MERNLIELEQEKRAYIGYSNLLTGKQKEGKIEENGIEINEELKIVNKHIENLTILIERKKFENTED